MNFSFQISLPSIIQALEGIGHGGFSLVSD